MIDYKQKYKELYTILVIVVSAILIIAFMIGIGLGKTKKQLNNKDEKIWQQETEIEDLKEQIHILSNSKESEEK